MKASKEEKKKKKTYGNPSLFRLKCLELHSSTPFIHIRSSSTQQTTQLKDWRKEEKKHMATLSRLKCLELHFPISFIPSRPSSTMGRTSSCIFGEGLIFFNPRASREMECCVARRKSKEKVRRGRGIPGVQAPGFIVSQVGENNW